MAEFPDLPDPNKGKEIDVDLHQSDAVFLDNAKKVENANIISKVPITNESSNIQQSAIKPNVSEKKSDQIPLDTLGNLTAKNTEPDIPKQSDYYSQKLADTNIPVAKNFKNIASEALSADETTASPTPPSRFWLIFKITLFIIAGFIFVYAFLNAPAIYKKLVYNYQKNTGQKPEVQTIIPTQVNQQLLFLDTVTNYAPKKVEEKPKLPSKEELGLKDLGNDELYIPKLDIKAPIVWDSPVDEDTMLNNLKLGLVHYKGTTKPGEKAEDGEGNVFISGHSSYYWWDDGKYKTIFANLDQLNKGDQIGIGYKDLVYVYKVFDKFEVDPSETSVLKQDTDKPILSLMTCVPVGTNLRRLIVKAELIARGTDNESLKTDTSYSTSESTSSPTPTVNATTPTTSATSTPASTPTSTSASPTPAVSSTPTVPNTSALELLPWI